MVYGAEVVLPLEVTMGSLRVQTYDEATQDQLRHEDVDLIDERRWQSAIKNARYRQTLKRIMSDSCVAENSRWMIWCSGGCSHERALTSSSLARRAPSE
jgi:hypothetical protein